MKEEEVWKPAKYIKRCGEIFDMGQKIEVSNLGNLRFTEEAMRSPYRKRSTPRIQEHAGYINLKWAGSKKYSGSRFPLQRIVLFSFNPEGWDEGLEVDHIDKNTKNNCLSNLRWTTLEFNRGRSRQQSNS